jgi:hypothetical protein
MSDKRSGPDDRSVSATHRVSPSSGGAQMTINPVLQLEVASASDQLKSWVREDVAPFDSLL